MLLFYRLLTSFSAPILTLLLRRRVAKGKEDAARLKERKGITALPRPTGALIWVHAASVGEAQSALILINEIAKTDPQMNFLVTSGTRTSADLMAQRLPPCAVHQYVPLDHPQWVTAFLDHWKPNMVLWMESELWPNMLTQIKTQNIPALLINARLSDKSFKRWKMFSTSAQKLLSTFNLILTQTSLDKERFDELGASNTHVSDNLKYSASPLPCDKSDLADFKTAIHNRPLWLYASTHDGEETMAARVHKNLVELHPNLLTIIVPRHPERREAIAAELKAMGTNITLRGANKNLPTDTTEIYIADTLGELGLFYTLSPIAMIGRSFSHDGGGGHNPIEAAQLNCAVLTGANIQYQKQLFAEMFAAGAAHQVFSEQELLDQLNIYLSYNDKLSTAIQFAKDFSQSKDDIINNVMEQIAPLLPPKEGTKNAA